MMSMVLGLYAPLVASLLAMFCFIAAAEATATVVATLQS
jgi:hypothetical protein